MHKPGESPFTDRELAEIRVWAKGRSDRTVRLRIVQDAAAGMSVSQSARRLGVSRPTVTAWRQRYAADGLAGLEHRPRSGRPATIDEADVVAVTLAGPPPPQRIWSARSLADHLGLSHTALGRVWQRWQVRPGTAADDGSFALPVEPPLRCRRPELLAVGASAQGRAFMVIAEAPPAVQARVGAATAEERQMRYVALTAVLRQVQSSTERAVAGHLADGVRPGRSQRNTRAESMWDTVTSSPDLALPPSIAMRWVTRHLHVITWGDTTGPAQLPVAARQHAAPTTMSWAATVCLMAQLELRHQPQSARVALDSLADSARDLLRTPPGRPFRWLREARASTVRRRRTVHRAFDQLATSSFNEKLVIESVRGGGSLSRAEIGERTGLTPQAVSRITRNLLTTGLLVEEERRLTRKGKPPMLLRLRPDAAFAVGIHIDRDKITHVLVDLCGQVRETSVLAVTARSDLRSCLEWMRRATSRAIEAGGPLSAGVLGVGVAAPGPLDVHEGVLLSPPFWAERGGFPIRSQLSRMLRLPVLLEKEATAAAMGEQWLGAGGSSGDFVYLYLGAGTSSGAFLNGDVYRGASGNAGEFGELTAYALGRVASDGGREPVPEYAPMSAVVARAMEAGLTLPDGVPAYEAVCVAAAAGDPLAVGAIRLVAQAVARGAAAMTDLYDSDLMIVGGPAVRPEVAELYLAEMSRAVNRFPMARRNRPVRVTYSILSTSAAAVGAATAVFHTTFAPRLRTHSGAAT
ncbi:ROK family protein [Streptomyces nigra]|uniref:ROK family protein n=1 Tax=Streptomyces nigra TaxID=1827580 RepID=UPI0036C81BE0